MLIFALDPMPQPRPKWDGRNGRMYTPAKIARYKKDFQSLCKMQFEHEPLDCSIELSITFHIARTKSISKRKTWVKTKPDLDNLEKAIMDAMEKIIYVNDSRVVRKVSEKVYGEGGLIEVKVKELD